MLQKIIKKFKKNKLTSNTNNTSNKRQYGMVEITLIICMRAPTNKKQIINYKYIKEYRQEEVWLLMTQLGAITMISLMKIMKISPLSIEMNLDLRMGQFTKDNGKVQ